MGLFLCFGNLLVFSCNRVTFSSTLPLGSFDLASEVCTCSMPYSAFALVLDSYGLVPCHQALVVGFGFTMPPYQPQVNANVLVDLFCLLC